MPSAQAIAAGVQAAGSIVRGASGWLASRQRAALLKRAAKQARAEGSQTAQAMADEAERAGATAAVVGAATGGGTGGSFAAMLEQLERAGTQNARSAIYAGRVEANNRLYEAQVAKAEGDMELVSSLFQAGGSLAGEYLRGAERKKQDAARRKLYVMGAR